MNTAPNPLQLAKDLFGSAAAMAEKLNKLNPENPVSRQAIYQWKQIPQERLLDVETVTGINRAELRPDLAKLFMSQQ